MRKLIIVLVIGALLAACEVVELEAPGLDGVDTPNKIMAIGDSRVEGGRPFYESYRYFLWKLLLTSGYEFDFIGSRKDDATYPDFMSEVFDRDHQGQGGATIQTIIEMEAEISRYQPDIILLGIGGNDLIEDYAKPDIVATTLEQLEGLIDGLRMLHPEAVILMEQIAPGHSEFMSPILRDKLEEYNAGIAMLVREKASEVAPVLVVDMSSDWQDDYLADEVHYSETGAEEIAERYFSVLEGWLQ